MKQPHVEIDEIHPKLQYGSDGFEAWIDFQFKNIEGTVRNASISIDAALYLAGAVESLMQHPDFKNAATQGPKAVQ